MRITSRHHRILSESQRIAAVASILSQPSNAFSIVSQQKNIPTFWRSSSSRRTRWFQTSAGSTGSPEDCRIAAPRASKAVKLLPSYLADARAVQKYSPSTPNGALQLGVAENQMVEDLLVPALTEFAATQTFPPDAIYYQPTQGRESCRTIFAAYLEDLLGLSKTLDVDGIVIGAGCNTVLENLCFCLAESGEGVMIPTPYYAAFEFDLVARAGTIWEKYINLFQNTLEECFLTCCNSFVIFSSFFCLWFLSSVSLSCFFLK